MCLWESKDYIGHSGRRLVYELWVCMYMYVTLRGGGGYATLKKKKHREQHDINQHMVCKIEEIGWDTFLEKLGKLWCVVCVGGGGCNSFKNGS